MKSEMNMMDLVRMSRDAVKASSGPKAGGAVEQRYGKNDGAPVKEGASQLRTQSAASERPAFNKILKAVASANRNAAAAGGGSPCLRGRTAAKTAQPEQSKEPADGGQPIIEGGGTTMEGICVESAFVSYDAQLSAFASDSAGEETAQALSSDASSLLKNAIETISNMLNLNIDPGLESVRIGNPTPAVKELLAEMLVALKGIVGVLSDAAASDLPVDMGSVTLDASQAAVLEGKIRTEVFHIEMALSMVECGPEVAELVAEKNSRVAAQGLIQAISPETVSMSASQLKQVLRDDDASDGPSMEALFAKLAHMLRERNGSDKKTAEKPGRFAPDAVTAGVHISQEAKKTPDVGDYGANVMRVLLKIDKTEAGNREAALQNEQFDLPKAAGALFAKKPGEMAGVRTEALDAVLQGVFSAKDQNAAGLIDHMKSVSVPKTLEDSVMNQLAGKLHEAIKTGVTEIRLLLRPESLGEMRVKLTIDGDVVMGKIYVENQQVKHIIETNMQSLKDSLAQHNLQTGSFDVNVGGHGRDQMNELAHGQYSRPLADDATDEDAPAPPDANADLRMGGETGRRFGSNTIEYFA